MKNLMVFLSLILTFNAYSNENWDVDSDLSQADLEVLELATDDEQDVADVSDYEYVEQRLEEETGDNNLIAENNDDQIKQDPMNEEYVEDEVQTAQAAPKEFEPVAEKTQKSEPTSNDAVGGSAPLFN